MNKIYSAMDIAIHDLRACYGDYGIYAGLHHFKDYWARDALFACLGALEINDFDIVKKNLKLFFNNLNKKGQAPLRVGRRPYKIILSFLGFNFKRTPLYTFDFNNKTTVDQNSLLIILFYEYIKKTKDKEFLLKYINFAKRTIEWNFYLDIDNDYLIEEEELSNWADSIKKKGKVLYSNVLHCHALKCISELYEKINSDLSKKYKKIYLNVKNKINELFWNSEHYIDWIDENKRYNYFSSDGNFLAVIFDIANKEKSKHIEEYSHIWDIHEIPSIGVHPKYPQKLIQIQPKLVGLKDYHNGLSWLWLGAINAIVKDKAGEKKYAIKILEKMSQIILKYKTVHEVYYNNGEPVNNLVYKSENPFAWSAGMFIYAVKKILKN